MVSRLGSDQLRKCTKRKKKVSCVYYSLTINIIDNAKRFNNEDIGSDTPYLRNLMHDLKNEISERFSLNRHAPL